MKEIPILFSTPMVQAIMDGRKTITRRVVKGTALEWLQPDGFTPEFVAHPDNNLCPYGKPGDILWVRETWCDYNDGYSEENAHLRSPDPWILYKADCKEFQTAKIWRPSIFMPKTICRIWLEVAKVRAERLHNITEEDARAEGVLHHKTGTHYLNYTDEKAGLTQFIYNCDTAAQSFKTLWVLINGFRDEPAAWFKNPWVWVIEFKILSTTGKPNIQS